MKLYIPPTKYPILHVCCPVCDNSQPHLMVKRATKISLDLRPLFCAQKGPRVELSPSSYLPFAETLKQYEVGKANNVIACIIFVINFCTGGIKEFEVFTTNFNNL